MYRFAILAIAVLVTVVPVQAQVRVPPLDNPVNRTLDRRLPPLDERIDSRAETLDERLDEAKRAADEALDDPAPGEVLETAGESVDGASSAAGTVIGQVAGTVAAAQQVAGNVANAALRPFVADIDPFGRTIEKNVLVVLVDTAQLADVTSFGLEVVEQRSMPGLGLTLVTLRGPNSHTLAQTAVDLRQAVPDAAVDYNHFYRAADARGTSAARQPAAPVPVADADPASVNGALRIGMIDSAVAAEHRDLTGIRIVPADFVTHDGGRPLGHGTAVASLIADATSREADIYAASVFFQVPGHAPGAMTESLVAALDWLATEQVDAINMSLAGPPNALLERALSKLDGSGPTVVAAVGNNGPSGDPQYPAAYEPVIGVTAVDRERRVFRYANRGQHVAFAAFGVNVRVADIGGGWRIESGTSMASPKVAAAVAAAYRQGHDTRAAQVDALLAIAEDLGQKGFDDVFGHGLIAESPTVVSRLKNEPQD